MGSQENQLEVVQRQRKGKPRDYFADNTNDMGNKSVC
jgi:hypothetical protein